MASLSRQRKQATPVQANGMGHAPALVQNKLEEFRPTLLSYDDIPEWHQDNDCIRYGYRPESDSVHACFASWLYIHNESINIFSHLVPAVLFLLAEGLVFYNVQASYPSVTIGDRLIFVFFLFTAAICLGMSATYHTVMNHSMRVSNLWLRLDLVGIIVLTLGDFVSGIYMVFYCEQMLQKIYWTMVCTALYTLHIEADKRYM